MGIRISFECSRYSLMVNRVIVANIGKCFALYATVNELLFQTVSDMRVLGKESELVREYIRAVGATVSVDSQIDIYKLTLRPNIVYEIGL